MDAVLAKEHIDFLRELRPHILASVLLFVLGLVLGGLAASQVFEIDSRFKESLGSFVETFGGLPKPMLASAIFVNNGVKTFLVVVLGLLGGVLPVCFLLLNGFAIGFVLYLSSQSHGILPSFLAIAPHGVFEIPAVVLGSSIGIFLGARALQRLCGQSGTYLTSDLGRGLKFFWRVLVPLLLIAAFVEAFVTSALVSGSPAL